MAKRVRSSTTKPKPNTTSSLNEEDLIAEITGTTGSEKEEVLSFLYTAKERKKSKKDNAVKSPLTEPSKKPAASGKGDQVITAIVVKEDMPRLEEDADSDGTFEAEEEEEETEDELIVSGRPDEDQYEAAVEDPNRRQARGHAAHDPRWEP